MLSQTSQNDIVSSLRALYFNYSSSEQANRICNINSWNVVQIFCCLSFSYYYKLFEDSVLI